MPDMPRGGYRRRHQPDRYEVHKAKMRGRVIVMMLAVGAMAAVLVAGVAMLASEP
jgi:hypothetical protein